MSEPRENPSGPTVPIIPVTVELWSDGAGNCGPGGWAYVLLAKRGDQVVDRTEGSGGEVATTNNRMELTAVIEGLRALKRPTSVSVYADSAYVVNAYVQGWVERWKARGWKRKDRKRLVDPENVDLWKVLDAEVQRHRVTFYLIKGHSGIPLNEYCDRLASSAIGGRSRARPVSLGFGRG